ncbi:MAG: TlpA family protein disulfide reductase [Acidimicrobiia bacterium]
MSKQPASKAKPANSAARGNDTPPQKKALFLILLAGLVIAAGIIAVVAARGPDKDKADAGDGARSIQEYRPVDVIGKVLPTNPDAGTDAGIGQVAPTVVGQTFTGDAVKIGGDNTPKVVMFLAHWCPHCQAEVPVITSYLTAKGMPQGVSLYAVATATDKARPNYPPSTWLEKAKWPVKTIADDSKYTASTAFGLNAFPYFVAINAEGKVTQRATGELTTQQFEALIASAKGA